MRWLLAVGALSLVPYRLIVAVGDAANGDPLGIGTLVVQLGLSAVFFWQWRSERDARKERDDQVVAILERQGPVLAQAIDVLKAVQDSQKSVAIRSATDWDDIADELRKFSEALNAEAGKRRRSDRG